MELQEQLTTETHVSEAAFRSLKLEEDKSKSKLREIQQLEARKNDLKKTLDEFKIKLEQLETENNYLKKQLEEKEVVLKSSDEEQKQVQTVIDGLRKDVLSFNQTVQILSTYSF